MVNYSQSKSTISRGRDCAASKDADQLDSAGQAILTLLHRAAGVAEANSGQAWKLLKGSRVSFTRPKTGSRS